MRYVWEKLLAERPDIARKEDGIYGPGTRFRIFYSETDETGRQVSPEGFETLDLQEIEREL